MFVNQDGSRFANFALEAPTLDLRRLSTAAQELFGVRGAMRSLGSQQDQNVLIEGAAGCRHVLKVGNPGWPRVEIEAQNAAITHVSGRLGTLETPSPVAGVDGGLICDFEVEGLVYPLRLLTYVDGTSLSVPRYLGPTTLRQVGSAAAQIAASLADFDHPGIHRTLQWDCRLGLDVVRGLLGHVTDQNLATLALTVAERAAEALDAVSSELRVQAIHGDVTDYNLVRQADGDGGAAISGLIDFGDVNHTWLASELAVAMASLTWHAPGRELEACRHVVAGFHATLPLDDADIAALWHLVCLRAAIVAVSGEQQAGLDPGSAYVAEAHAREWDMLRRVALVPEALAEEHFRAHLRRCPRRTTLVPAPWSTSFELLEGQVLRDAPVLDLSTASDLFDCTLPIDAARTRDAIEAGYGAVAVGRYGERRMAVHRGPELEEPATVHLGIDVFAAAGTIIRAPISGAVERGAPRELRLLCAGLEVILRHVEPLEGEVSVVERGDPVARIAPQDADALLPAHVHVQVMRDPHVPAPALVPDSLSSAWQALSPDPSALLGLAPSTQPDATAVRGRRERVLAAVQEEYYERPVAFEHGSGAYLWDTTGRAYLDMINNVAGIGHGHPGLADAVHRQLRRLNTNSRFLYEANVEYAERLAALLPPSLDTVFLVNSGSEANDLALRIARAATGHEDVIAVRGGYHGWTRATDDVSTSLTDNPRAVTTRPPWVHLLPSPNAFRGEHRGVAAAAYGREAARQIRESATRNGGVATFIAEAVFGNAGGMQLPGGYLRDVYAAVRERGGLCLADEVQVGFGRLGEHFWGFEEQGVLPDLVTVAKAAGNGVPVGAVVTTRELADRFAVEGSFFSSGGGSAAACVAGIAVLDAIVEDDLQGNARRVGRHLKDRLEALVARHPLCGGAHGMGLYQGLELVRDPDTLVPATREARAICARMLDLGVVVQPTGDHANVLKIKPPLTLRRSDADHFVDALDHVLETGW